MLAIFASLQSLTLGEKKYEADGLAYTHFNNYIIFKQSFFHLLQQQDLYVSYPDQHWDLYKYTPTFSLLFGVFAMLPDAIGVVAWNLLNALLLWWAVFSLKGISDHHKSIIALAGSIELLTSMQNEQSNALMAALMIGVLVFCQRSQFVLASAALVLAVLIKPFAIIAGVFFLFYPKFWRNTFITAALGTLGVLLPVVVTGFDGLVGLYQSWLHVLSEDHQGKYGFSVIGWLHSWFNVHPDKTLVTVTGLVLLILPLRNFESRQQPLYQLLWLSSMLIWVVIFNHMAESPTFIIAITGAAIWFVAKPRHKTALILFLMVIFFVSLSNTDLVPKPVRQEFIRPYVMKAVPCIILWVMIWREMLFYQLQPNKKQEVNNH